MRVRSPLRVRVNVASPPPQSFHCNFGLFRHSRQRAMLEPSLDLQSLKDTVEGALLDCLAVVAVLSLADACQSGLKAP